MTMPKLKPSRAKGLLLTRFLISPYNQLSHTLDQWGVVVGANYQPGYILEVTVRAIKIRKPKSDRPA